MSYKLSFISYPVSNLNQSIIFYRDVLGLKLLLNNGKWAEFNVDDQRLAIHEKKVCKDLEYHSGAVVYFEAKPIEEVVKDLITKGIKFSGDIEIYTYGKLVLFSDPDNNSLGLYEPPTKEIIYK